MEPKSPSQLDRSQVMKVNELLQSVLSRIEVLQVSFLKFLDIFSSPLFGVFAVKLLFRLPSQKLGHFGSTNQTTVIENFYVDRNAPCY